MQTIASEFKVAAISSNTNSFGLYGVVIINREGIAYELGISKIHLPEKGVLLICVLDNNNRLLSIPGISYEIPHKLPTAPKNILDELFPQSKSVV